MKGSNKFKSRAYADPSIFPQLLTALPDTIEKSQGLTLTFSNTKNIMVFIYDGDTNANQAYKTATDSFINFTASDLNMLLSNSIIVVNAYSPVLYNEDSASFSKTMEWRKGVYVK